MQGFPYIPRSIALESLLFPTRWFTRSVRQDHVNLLSIAQVERAHESGRFLWMLPADEVNEHANQLLLDQLCVEAGHRGCLFLSANISEDSYLIDTFKTNGFSPVGWEQVWRFEKSDGDGSVVDRGWRPTTVSDLPAINRLQSSTLSSADKSITQSVYQKPPQFSYTIDGTLHGFAYVINNNKSVILTPTYSSAVASPEILTKSLIVLHFYTFVFFYVVQQSNQIWAESILLEHYKKVTGKRLRMVKHLTVRNSLTETQFNQFSNGRHTDIVTPLSKSIEIKDKI